MGWDALMRFLALCLAALALLIAAPAEAQLSVSSGQCTITAAGGTGAKTCAHGNSSTPTLVIWYGSDVAAGTAAGQDGRFLWGASASSTDECAIAGHFDQGVTTMNTTSGTWADASIVRLTNGDAVDALADFTSFDATNLNFNVSDAPATDFTVQFITFAGTGLSVDVNADTISSGTGSQSISGVSSFAGKLIIVARARASTGASGAAGPGARFSVGAATSSTSRFAMSAVSVDAAADADTKGYWDDDNIIVGLTTAGAVDWSFDFTSFDSTGYTINKTDDNGGDTAVCRILMGGTDFSAAVGTEAQRTSNGTTTITGLGHTPEAALFIASSGVTEDTAADNWKTSFGSAAGVATMRVAALASNDAAATEASGVQANATKVLAYIGGVAGTSVAEADLDSFSSGQMVVDWTTTDATARRYGYITMENSAPAGSGQPPSSLRLLGVGAP